MKFNRLITLVLTASALYAQAPAISNVVVDRISKSAARFSWNTTEVILHQYDTTLQTALNSASGYQNVTLADATNYPQRSVMKIGNEYIKVDAPPSGNVVVGSRGYNARTFLVDVGMLVSIAVAGNTATATTAVPHQYVAGELIQVMNSVNSNLARPYTIQSTPSPTTFTFTTSGVPDGVYTERSLTLRNAPEPHNIGDSVSRAGNDTKICWSTDTSYSSCTTYAILAVNPQVNFHYQFVSGLTPNTTYHYKICSQPNALSQSACGATPGANEVQATGTFTTLADTPAEPQPIQRTFDTAAPTTFATTVSVGANCNSSSTGLQAAINSVAAMDGNNNYKIVVPSSLVCNGNYTLKRKTGANANGAGWIMITTDQENMLPPEGVRIVSSWYSPFLPKIQTQTGAPVFSVEDNTHHYYLMGLEVRDDPTTAIPASYQLISTLGNFYEDSTKGAHHMIFARMYVHSSPIGNAQMGIWANCDYCAVVDSWIDEIHNAADGGAVQGDNGMGPLKIINNHLESAMSGIFISDNGARTNQYVSDIEIRRNFVTKPKRWKLTDPAWFRQVQLPVATITRGNPTIISTATQNNITNGVGVTFTGATGDWAALNTSMAMTNDGSLLNITCDGSNCTVTTRGPHNVQPGAKMYIPSNLGMSYGSVNAGLRAVYTVAAVPSATTFTFPSSIGAGVYRDRDLQAYTFFAPNGLTANQFSIPVDSTNFSDPASQNITVSYGRVLDIKNTFEFKVGRRALVQGNVIENSFSQAQSGGLLLFTALGPFTYYGWPMMLSACTQCNRTIESILVRDNIFRSGCQGLVLGGFDYQSISAGVINNKLVNNLFYDISADWSGTGTCGTYLFGGGNGWSDLTITHNTGIASAGFYANKNPSGPLTLTDNVFRYGVWFLGNECNGGFGSTAFQSNGCLVSGHTFKRNVLFGDPSAFNPMPTDNWNYQWQYYKQPYSAGDADYNNNYWPSLQANVNFAGNLQVTDASNAAPIVVTAAHNCSTGDKLLISGEAGNTAVNGVWRISVIDNTHFSLDGSAGNGAFRGGPVTALPVFGSCIDFRLAPSSPFKSGTQFRAAAAGAATDGSDVGANIAEIDQAIGKVTFKEVSVGSTQAVFKYSAPTGEHCYIDLSSDNFASAPARTDDQGGGADRWIVIPNLQPSTPYNYRLLCSSYQFSGNFVTIVDSTDVALTTIKVKPAASLHVASALVEFGTSPALGNAATPVTCTTGCTLSASGTKGRVLYYRTTFKDASNRTIQTSPVEATIP